MYMKKLLPLLLSGLLLIGCSKINERIDKLTNRVDELERTTIPGIDQQLESIQKTLPQLQQTDEEIKGYIAELQERLAKLEQSLSELDAEVANLGQEYGEVVTQLNEYRKELEGRIESINALIESLQAADSGLEEKIAALDGRLDDQQDWVTATFATLEQYNGLVGDIASIEASIEAVNASITDLEARMKEKIATDIAAAVSGLEEELQAKVAEITDAYTQAIATAREELTAAYTAAIDTAIADCIDSMKSWVNELLANYYDIAAVDAKLQLLQDAIAAGDAATEEKLKGEIDAVNKSIESARAELTAAYEEAIAAAIEEHNGVIESKLAEQLQSVNSRIDREVKALTERIDAIEARLEELEGRVDDLADELAALLKRIQSISYIPRYDDGKIEVLRVEGQDNGIAEMDYQVSPRDVVAELEKVWEEAVSVKAVHTKTRAVDFIEMPVIGFEADAETGVITVKASGENLGEEFFAGTQSASAALCISDGNNDVTSEYVPMEATSYDPLKTIFYTTSDGKTISPKMSNIIGNTYVDGQGVILFDSPVTKIPISAFKDIQNLTSITLPSGVTTIEKQAFFDCKSLTNITIPESVTAIDQYAFNTCFNLTSIVSKYASPDQRCLIIDGKLVLFAQKGLTEYTIPDGVTTIGDQMFSNCQSLTNITIPESVTTIGKYAFSNCNNLTSVTIPDSVISIGDNAFTNCYNLISFSGKYASSDHRCLVVDGKLVAFAKSGLTEYTIPDGVRTIGPNAFYGCGYLTTIIFPNGVNMIRDDAFLGCTKLTNIILPESLTWIGSSAFLCM